LFTEKKEKKIEVEDEHVPVIVKSDLQKDFSNWIKEDKHKNRNKKKGNKKLISSYDSLETYK